MGGFGSGKWADVVTRKDTVDYSREITIRFLKDNGFLDADKRGVILWTNAAGDVVGKVDLQTSVSVDVDKTPLAVVRRGVLSTEGQEKTLEQEIKLTNSPCNYGGRRWWFECPVVKDGVYCGNRITKLFLPPGGEYFGCRECHDLTYESCQKSHKYDRIIDHIPEDLDLSGLNVNQVLRLAGL